LEWVICGVLSEDEMDGVAVGDIKTIQDRGAGVVTIHWRLGAIRSG